MKKTKEANRREKRKKKSLHGTRSGVNDVEVWGRRGRIDN